MNINRKVKATMTAIDTNNKRRQHNGSNTEIAYTPCELVYVWQTIGLVALRSFVFRFSVLFPAAGTQQTMAQKSNGIINVFMKGARIKMSI